MYMCICAYICAVVNIFAVAHIFLYMCSCAYLSILCVLVSTLILWTHIYDILINASRGARQWRIQGGQIRPWPSNRSWQWSMAPLGGRRNNDSIVNLAKCKDFGSPYRCRLWIW